jgi:hypothetical protein
LLRPEQSSESDGKVCPIMTPYEPGFPSNPCQHSMLPDRPNVLVAQGNRVPHILGVPFYRLYTILCVPGYCRACRAILAVVGGIGGNLLKKGLKTQPAKNI